MTLTKLLTILLSVPKTIWFNLRYMPLRQAVALPIWLHHSVCVKKCYRGGVELSEKLRVKSEEFATAEGANDSENRRSQLRVRPMMIRIGFHTVDMMNPRERTVLCVRRGGKMVFAGTAHIGKGSKIAVNSGGRLTLGDNFAISASSEINCYKAITFGRDIQFSWDCLVMDCDTHTILDTAGQPSNEARPITFGDKVWIGCRSTILKGSTIPSNCVIGACSLVSGSRFEEKTIIAGSPAKSVKTIGGWRL